jgi:4-diphosphocytidyl-2-C-methyl-D-erythritol kinase
MESISSLSNAKINLFLAINGIRSDGFCDVSTIILPIDFGDNMVLSLQKNTSNQGPTIEIRQHYPLKFPEESNTITRAVELFCEQTTIRNFSLRIDIEKKIPIGGGFGGGSSNGAFVLKALNQFYHSPLPKKHLTSLAQKIGTDCPFFIDNCPQIATGRGDILAPIPASFCQNLMNYFALIFCPPFFISTDNAYEKLKQKSPFKQNSSEKVEGIKIEEIKVEETKIEEIFAEKHFQSSPFNAFQRQILNEHTELKMLFDHLYQSDYFPCITGSGSGCFILHREYDALRNAQKIVSEKLGPIPLCKITHFLRAPRP